MNEIKATFLGWDNMFGKFAIEGTTLPNDQMVSSLIVAYEGKWIEDLEGLYPEIRFFEDAQKKFGTGLRFCGKEYCGLLKRSFFKFAMSNSEATLVTPATGEELHFEIYGCDLFGSLFLLLEQEL